MQTMQEVFENEVLLLRQQNADLKRQLDVLQEHYLATSSQLQQEICDRQRAETALQTSEAEFQALFNAMQDVILILNAEGQCLKVVATNSPLLCGEGAELLGKPLHQVLPLTTADFFLNTIRQVLASRKPANVEYCLAIAAQEIWFEAHVAPMGTDTVVWIAQDKTEQKQAAEELKSSEARFRSYFELPLIGIAITSPEKGWVSVNDTACEMLGYTRQELMQLTWSELTHPEDLVLDLELFQQMLCGSTDQYSMEKRYFRKDGVMIYASLAVGCTRKPDGTVDYVAALMQDVTDRKLAETALKESEQQLREQAEREKLLNRLIHNIRSSLDFNTVLLTTLQEVQGFLQVSRCCFAWYFPEAEPPYWEVVQDFHGSSLPSLKGCYPGESTLLVQWLNQKVVKISDVATVADENLRRFLDTANLRSFIAASLQLSPNLGGSLICGDPQERQWREDEVELLQRVMEQLAIAFNQSDLYAQMRAKAEELEQTLGELQQTQTKMIQSEKMSSLGQLVAGVAHEINNPVNFIAGNLIHAKEYANDLLYLVRLYQQHYPNPAAEIQDAVEAVDLEFLTQDLPKLLMSMGMGADRIQKIVLSLRNFSRMDEAEQKAVDVHEGIDSTLMILQSRCKAKGDQPDIKVIKEYGKLPLVDCYPGQLNQVFMNILSNAIDALEHSQSFAPKSLAPKSLAPKIWIRTEPIGSDRISIKIADNGSGIPPELQTRLFDPFFTTKPVGKGTGLGLSISYQIVVEKHQGQLSCSSTPEQGTEFQIEIPVYQ